MYLGRRGFPPVCRQPGFALIRKAVQAPVQSQAEPLRSKTERTAWRESSWPNCIRSFSRTASLGAGAKFQSSQILCRQNSLQLLQRLHPLQPVIAVRARRIEQYCLQARAGRTEIIDRINIADIEAVLWANIHFVQRSLKNFCPRLLASNQARIRDGVNAIGNAAMCEDVCNLAIGIGHHASAVVLAKV